VKRLGRSDFYHQVHDLKEPVEVADRGKLLGTFYPVGQIPASGYQPVGVELAGRVTKSHIVDGHQIIDEVQVTGASLVKTLARQEAQAQRDDWLRKMSSPPREFKRK